MPASTSETRPGSRHNISTQILASSTGSLISTILLSPLGVVKARIQTNSALNIRTAITAVATSGGVKGFWAGAPAGILLTVPSTALYMVTYEHLQTQLGHYGLWTHAATLPAISGALARTLCASVTAPIELIRTKQTGGNSGSIASVFSEIMRTHGVRGLYRGWANTVLRDAPFSAIYWFCFASFRPKYRSIMKVSSAQSNNNQQQLKQNLHSHSNKFREPIATFLSGSSSGVVAAVLTHPFDLWKTRVQILKPEEAIIPSVPHLIPTDPRVHLHNSDSSNILKRVQCWVNCNVFNNCNLSNLKCFKTYLNDTLFRGLPLRLAIIIPGGGIMVTVYETVKTWDAS